MDDGILVNAAAGYQPFEYLQGSSFKVDPATGTPVSLFSDNDRVSFSRPGIFGHCEDKTPALFMQNAKEDTCVVAYAPVTAQTCSNVNYAQILRMLRGDASTTELVVKPTTGAMKFDLNSFREVTLLPAELTKVSSQEFLEAKFAESGGQCSCDNFVLEAHYKVFFDQSPSTANQFSIRDFVVDVVYGKLTQDCAKPFTFNLKTSVIYLQDERGRAYSGSPGYLRGSPILVGKTSTITVSNAGQGTTSITEAIVTNKHGFPLRGASNDGACYFVDQAISGEKTKLTDTYSKPLQYPIIDTTDVKTYFEDPVLTFEDSLIYGCSVQLNHEEFKDFCSNSLFQHLMLFQNLFLMDKIGVSGNADPQYTNDWIVPEVPESSDTF